jgi:uncharacterized protein YbjT (DUF2867 family)
LVDAKIKQKLKNHCYIEVKIVHKIKSSEGLFSWILINWPTDWSRCTEGKLMSGDNCILVTGASGRTGRAVISALNKKGAYVRAFIRRADVVDDIKLLGAAEILLGDLFETESLAAAVSGCSQVIHICPPMNQGEAELAKTVTDLCLSFDVRRLVLYSVLHPLLSDVRHHHLKLQAEEYLVNSGQVYTILQPGRYMQHHVQIWKEIIETGKHRMPFNINAKFNIVDVADLAEAVARVLTEEGHEAATYQLAGPHSLSQIDMARIISEVTGKVISAEFKPFDELRSDAEKKGMSADRIQQLYLMNKHYDNHGLVGNPNILEWLLDRPPIDFATYIRNFLA